MNQKNTTIKIKSIIMICLFISSTCFLSLFSLSQFQVGQAASDWNQTSNNDFENGTMYNLSVFGKGTNARLEINLSELMPWQKMEHWNNPISRFGHAMAPIWGTDKVLLFGGQTMTSSRPHLSDTWVYDYSDNVWTQRAPTNKPSARRYHAMASVFGDDKVVLHGGTSSVDSMEDLWIYDYSDDQWTEKPITIGSGPEGRYHQAMATIEGDDKVLIVGGWYQSEGTWRSFDETWVYDLSDDQWIPKASLPYTQVGHSMSPINGTDKYVLFGGGPTYLDNETWLYDYSDDNWTLQIPDNNPEGRRNYGMVRVRGTDKVLLFGGEGITMNNETWLYDLSENNWTKRETNAPPSIRDDLGMSFIYGVDRVLLFGGSYKNVPNDWVVHDDTWLYRHRQHTKNGTFISEPFDCGQNSSFYELQWYANIPKNTSIKFQLRTADNASNLANADFVGPHGTDNTFYTTSPTSIWSGHNGHRWVQYKAYLNISIFTDSPTINDVTITYNCLPEIVPTNPVDGCILTKPKPTFHWAFKDHDSAHQRSFQVMIDNDISFNSIEFDSSEQFSAEENWSFPVGTNYTELPDGSWYWKVRAKDTDDVWTEFCEPRALVMDTHAPTSAVVIPVQDGFYDNLTTISGIATDGENATGISAIKLIIKNIRYNKYWNGTAWVTLQTWLAANGTEEWIYDASNITWVSGERYLIKTMAKDLASNLEMPGSGNNFRFDTDSPISYIQTPKNDLYLNTLKYITGTSMDISGSGITLVEISIKCVKDDNQLDGLQNQDKYFNGRSWVSSEHWLPAEGTINWTFDTGGVSWSTGNKYLIRSRASDRTGNYEQPGTGNIIFYDDQPPNGLSIIINNDEQYTKSAEVSLTLDAEDLGFGVTNMSFSTDGSEWTDWVTFNPTKVFELQGIDNEKVVYFRVRDRAKNIAEAVFDNIVLDTNPPMDLKIIINDNEEYSRSTVVNLTLQANDILSGTHQMAFSFYGIIWTPWEPFKVATSVQLPSSDGVRSVYFKVKDRVNNTAIPVYDTITLDSTKPYLLALSINDKALETNATAVTLKLAAQDVYDYGSGVNGMSFSFNGDAWTAWEPFRTEKALILPTGDGEKTVYFRVNDHAGNTAQPVSATIFLNTTVPSEIEKIVDESDEESDFILYLIMVIIVALVIIAIVMVLIIKRRKRYVQELLPPGVLTIKPGGLLLPSVNSEEITAILESGKTPTSTSTTMTMTSGTVEPPQAIAPPPQKQVPALPSYGNAQGVQQNTVDSATGSTQPQMQMQQQQPDIHIQTHARERVPSVQETTQVPENVHAKPATEIKEDEPEG